MKKSNIKAVGRDQHFIGIAVGDYHCIELRGGVLLVRRWNCSLAQWAEALRNPRIIQVSLLLPMGCAQHRKILPALLLARAQF